MTAPLDATFTGAFDYTSPAEYGSASCPNAVVVEYDTSTSIGGAPGVELSWVDVVPASRDDCTKTILAVRILDMSGATPVTFAELSKRGAWLYGGASGIDSCLAPATGLQGTLKFSTRYRIVATARTDESSSAATHAIKIESRHCPQCEGR